MIIKKRLSVFTALLFLLLATTLWQVPNVSAESYRLVTLEYPPYEYSEDGVIKGLVVEIVNETFKLMNHEVQIEIYPWARSIKMFKNGEADGIFSFFKTPEREVFTFYSNEIILAQKMSLWVRKDSDISFNGDLSSLQGYRIGVVRKTSYGNRFDTAVQNGTIKAIEAYTIEDAINLLINKRIDLWVSNFHGAIYKLGDMGTLGVVKELQPTLEDIPTYIGFSKVKKLDHLRDDFDKAFSELKKSGKYSEILQKYVD